MTHKKEFELLRKDYILKIQYHLEDLKSLTFQDLAKTDTKARLALHQSECSVSFMALCTLILKAGNHDTKRTLRDFKEELYTEGRIIP